MSICVHKIEKIQHTTTEKMQIYYPMYFGHAQTCSPNKIVSPCTKHLSLPACKKLISPLVSFTRYYTLRILRFDQPTAFWSPEPEPGFC